MLATLELLKYNFLSIEAANTEHDDALTDALEAASSYIETYCNQPIEQATKTHYFAGKGNGDNSLAQILLGNAGVAALLPWTTPVSLTSLKYRVSPIDSWTAVATGSAAIYEQGGCKYVYCSQGLGWPHYQLIASVGFTSIPAELQQACCQIALYFWNETKASGNARGGVDSTSTTQGGLTTTQRFKDVLAQVAAVLNKYKIYPV